MRKNLLHHRRKNLLYSPLFLLLIVSMSMTSVSATPELPKLHIEPPTAIISAPGENVTVAINATNVENYYGADFQLFWNRSIICAIAVTVHGPGAIVDILGLTDAQHVLVVNMDCTYNATHGRVMFSDTFVYGQQAPTFTGNGTVAWITFEGLMEGVTDLSFDPKWTKMFELVNMIPGYMDMDPPVGGEITVIPEFPAATVISLFLIATLAATLLGKLPWSRKRRDTLTAE